MQLMTRPSTTHTAIHTYRCQHYPLSTCRCQHYPLSTLSLSALSPVHAALRNPYTHTAVSTIPCPDHLPIPPRPH